MIKGKELLNNCVNEILQLASGLEAKYGTIIITSGYRSPEYNKSVGGAKDSYHTKGKAADIKVSGLNSFELAQIIEKLINQTKLVMISNN